MTPMTEEFLDYSTILMEVERLEKELHDACLHKQFDKVPKMANDLIEQALLLKLWVKNAEKKPRMGRG